MFFRLTLVPSPVGAGGLAIVNNLSFELTYQHLFFDHPGSYFIFSFYSSPLQGRGFHSVLKLFTGFAIAALIA